MPHREPVAIVRVDDIIFAVVFAVWILIAAATAVLSLGENMASIKIKDGSNTYTAYTKADATRIRREIAKRNAHDRALDRAISCAKKKRKKLS